MSLSEVPSYMLTEAELIEYSDLVTKRQEKSVPPPRNWVSAVYVPLALGVLLMGFFALRGVTSQGDFGRLLFVGTVAYLGGYFALRYELERHRTSWLMSYSHADPLYQGSRQIMLRGDGPEYLSDSSLARIPYRAFTEVEITDRLVLGWLGPGTALPVPTRVFANRSDAEAFAANLKRRIDGARPTNIAP